VPILTKMVPNKLIEECNLETLVSTLIITNVGKFIFFMKLQF
jgi:hypothetical protein